MASRHGAHTKIERCCSVSAQERSSEACLSNEGDVEVEVDVGSRSRSRSRLLFVWKDVSKRSNVDVSMCADGSKKTDGKVQEY